MRVVVFIKADKDSEAGVMPDERLMGAMMKFNEELVNAGVMLAAEGLQPSSKGVRVRYSGGKNTVIHGPFTEVNELVAGYWLWKVNSMDEAVGWIDRMSQIMKENNVPDPPQGAEIEIRPIGEWDDFVQEHAPELKAKEQELRSRTEEQNR
jgi:hypothetical protein